MKILLLTDIPPCKNFTAGLVLDQLCRLLPQGSVACFAIVNPHIEAKLSADLGHIPIAYSRKRHEYAFRPFPGLLSLPIAWLVEKLTRQFIVPKFAVQAVEFGREQNVDLVWAVLQGQTVTQIATDVAHRLKAPLVTQVWDPLSWWLFEHRIERFNRRSAIRDFDRALRASRTCITASWAMAEQYRSQYGTRCVPVITSHPRQWAIIPNLSAFPRQEINIGMAGQFYAGAEWAQLVRALNMSGWQVRGRSVRLTVLGATKPSGEIPAGRMRYLGWRGQREAAELLSKLDLLYCPYPFAAHMKEVAALSFPSKLVLYLMAGRPVLFHGPDWSSPAQYLRDHNAGIVVSDSHAAAIYNAICRIVDDPRHYVEVGVNAQRAFERDFTLESMRTSFEEALGVSFERIPSSPQGSLRRLHFQT